MNRCICGSSLVLVDAVLSQRSEVGPDGVERKHWVGDDLGKITCEACGREVMLDAFMTIQLMNHLIEQREKQVATGDS